MVTSTVVADSGNGQAYLSIGSASRKYSLHPSTLRRWCDSGRLPALTTIGGWRRIRESDLQTALGVSVEGDTEKERNVGGVSAKVALLARVSGAKQGQGFNTESGQRKENGQESDLERQVFQLQKHCREKYGIDGQLYSDIGSGLNYNRPNFLRLLTEICEGKLSGGVVILSHRDRAMRFGFPMLETVCKVNHVSIDILDRQTEVSDSQEMSEDILGIITHFSAKQHGLRSAMNNTFTLAPEAVSLAKELKDSGYSILHITRVLKKEGFPMSNNRGIVRPVTSWVVNKLFENGSVELLEVALPKEENEVDGTSWDLWVKKHIRITGKETDKLTMREVYEQSYKPYCNRQDTIPVSVVMVGKWLKRHCLRRYRSMGRAKFSGLVLV